MNGLAADADCRHYHFQSTRSRHALASKAREATFVQDILDHILLGKMADIDELDLSFRRQSSDLGSRIIYFLPWRTSFEMAARLRLMPDRYMICYELPHAIVSSEPTRCAQAMRNLVEDVLGIIIRRGIDARDLTFVGASMGSAPATQLASLCQARVCSIVSADCGSLMLWQSPAAALVRSRAIAKGYSKENFALATVGMHPVDNLGGLSGDSIFVVSENDLFVPPARRDALLAVLAAKRSDIRICRSGVGHVRTIMQVMRALDTILERSTTSDMAALLRSGDWGLDDSSLRLAGQRA